MSTILFSLENYSNWQRPNQQAKKWKKVSATSLLNTIVYAPTNNKILSLIVLAMILPDARSKLVYDCTTQKNNIHSFSFDEVKECQKFQTQYDNGTLAMVQIISCLVLSCLVCSTTSHTRGRGVPLLYSNRRNFRIVLAKSIAGCHAYN